MRITVVGAGIVGLSIAHELASRGVSVRIVDGRGVGQGATRASAGMLAPYIEGHSPSLLKLALCSLHHYDAYIARIVADAGRAIQYRRNGTLEVAVDEAEAARLADTARDLQHAGVAHTLVGGEGAHQLEPALGVATAGLLIPQHGSVVVRELVAALEAALLARGVNVVAERIDDLVGEASRADAVIVAAGSWTSRLPTIPAGVDRQLRPIRGQLLHVKLPERVAAHVLWSTRCYIVPWDDGSVLIGATSEDVGFDERSTVAGVRSLLDAGVELLPAVDGAAFEAVRVGLRPSTTDGLPVIGRSSTMPRVFYATGHYRNGVLLAPWTTLAVADLVLDGRERAELSLVRPERFGL